ncbi:hypothetical protein [Streptacidiphilus sp. EB129]|uniref:hypothetical protein n=1 Tax=Streptacidiphilus sp. EB129 TaxID=3156262 RepID=UPI0035194E3A
MGARADSQVGARLDKLVQAATVHAHGEDEEIAGLFAKVQKHLGMPFVTKVPGEEVKVIGVDLLVGGIVAICARGSQRRTVGLLNLPLPTSAPGGAEWIHAYRHWAGLAPQ